MSNRQKNSVLIVDDDRQLTTMLSELLESEGFTCAVAPNGARGLLLLNEQKPDLVVLDVMMPGDDGIETLKSMRQSSDVPVIMLTALGDDEDRIKGLEAGADDYLAKPFVARELLLRIHAILKRTAAGTLTTTANEPLSIGNLRIDPDRQKAWVSDAALTLTNAEMRILSALAERDGAVVTREFLSRYALGRELLPQDRTLDTHISNLRRKIADAGNSACAIRASRGAGYRLTTG